LIDYSRDSVWLRATQSGRSRYMLADEEQLRISSPYQRGTLDLEDVVDKVVTLSFAEGKAISIVEEWQEEELYTLLYVDPGQLSIRVVDAEQKHYIYKLPETVLYQGMEYDLEALSR